MCRFALLIISIAYFLMPNFIPISGLYILTACITIIIIIIIIIIRHDSKGKIKIYHHLLTAENGGKIKEIV